MPLTKFRPRIRSRHPSHDSIRNILPLFHFKSVVRLGSTTDMMDTVSNGGNRIELNTIDSVKNSSSKLRMKRCFAEAGVTTAEYWTKESLLSKTFEEITSLPYPLIGKRVFGSRGKGIELIPNRSKLSESLLNSDYLYEKYYNYSREYRLHVTKHGCFYTCRKMLKQDVPDDERFYRNDSNCVWYVEENENFDKPKNWDDIVNDCIKALNSVNLDFGACDVRVQSSRKSNGNLREYPKYIVVEINSAPSFGEGTLNHYKQIIPGLLNEKYARREISVYDTNIE